MTETGTLLEVEHLTMRFGGLVAIEDLSFTAQHGAITAMIGPNGAGKTTVFNCITGFYKPSAGRLTLHRTEGDFLLERMVGFRFARSAGVAPASSARTSFSSEASSPRRSAAHQTKSSAGHSLTGAGAALGSRS